METIFPTSAGYQGAFLVSFRKNPLSLNQRETQRVGTVLLKRSYAIDAGTGVLTPQASPVPIFLNDQLDGSNVLRYESDIVAYKPEADVIVLGFAGTNGVHEAVVGTQTYLMRTISGPGERDLFGWEPRFDSALPQRRQQAGGYRDVAADYPALWPVPANAPERDPLPGGPNDPRIPAFDNRYYNGYRRMAALAAAQPFDYPETTMRIEIQRDDNPIYRFTLGAETVTAAYFYYIGTGADDECAWRRVLVQMHLDTLVVEPDADANRCYVVWRGAWDFDQHLPDLYRRLRVDAS